MCGKVDNFHKQIEDAKQVAVFYSRISFIKVLLNVNHKNPLITLQMVKSDFNDFMNWSKFTTAPEFLTVLRLLLQQVVICVISLF